MFTKHEASKFVWARFTGACLLSFAMGSSPLQAEDETLDPIRDQLDILAAAAVQLENSAGEEAQMAALKVMDHAMDQIDKICMADADKFFQAVRTTVRKWLRGELQPSAEEISQLIATLRRQIEAARAHIESFHEPPKPQPVFRRGDSNDDGAVNLTDAIHTLLFLFTGGETPTCLKSADANDDGQVEIGDPIATLLFVFLGGSAPPAPFSVCAADPTADELTCYRHGSCQSGQ